MLLKSIDKTLYKKNIVEFKKFFNSHPEKGLCEFKTSEFIYSKLLEFGYKNIKNNLLGTGILATLETNRKGPCLLFRADIDAVMIDKINDKEIYRHSCGHDAHMSVMLTLAKYAFDNRDKLCGTIKFIFQPDEEGEGGAKKLIEQYDILENPTVDYVFGLHVWSELKSGTFTISDKAIMASTDPFDIIIEGRSGHAGLPAKCIDPIAAGVEICKKIDYLKQKYKSLNKKIVLGITAFNSGSTNNVIPQIAKLKGICRTFDNLVRQEVLKDLKEIVDEISKEYKVKYHINFSSSSPAVQNDREVVKTIKQISSKIVSDDCIDEDYCTMCSEDFSYYLQKVKGCFILVGCQRDKYYPQHSPDFLVSDNDTILGFILMQEILNFYCLRDKE